MKPLAPHHRKQLERVVADARDVAEQGARAAIEALAVHQQQPYAHMDELQLRLRRRLRAHARQLGDRRDGTGTQSIEHLVQECAFEQWHGMLFALFLAENNLLIEPEMGVAVTLDECEELAKELVRTGDAVDRGIDKWLLAARFAHAMLRQVFRADLPVFEVRFAQEHRQQLEALVEGLPAEVFTASDALGWVYQFWQSRKKAEVNRSEAKIGADELPPVTQLFTEPYMVSFLLDNALGAWWAARRLTEADFQTVRSEAELRERAAIPGVSLEYLRFVEQADTDDQPKWRLAAGDLDGWPAHLSELKVLDPCCGSGHFLVAAFAMLVPMRMALEGLSASDAVNAVIRQNLHGLEIDARCVEIAVFAIALAAWRFPNAGGYRPLPRMNIACSGLSVGTTKAQWEALAGGKHNPRIAMTLLYDLFKDAPTLGSLLNPAETEAADLVDWPDVSSLLAEALSREQPDEQRETMLAAWGLAGAAELLAGRYHLVATNVPYLARGKQAERLKQFLASRHPSAKNDLATAFLERCLALCTTGGVASVVLPQNWLYLTRYKTLRVKLLQMSTWRVLAQLGPGAFETISGEIVKAILLRIEPGYANGPLSNQLLDRKEEGGCGSFHSVDVSTAQTPAEKAMQLRGAGVACVQQLDQLKNPDAKISMVELFAKERLGDYCVSIEGLATGDLLRFTSKFWEGAFTDGWVPYIDSVTFTTHFGGRTDRVFWEDGKGVLSRFPSAHNFPREVMHGRRILGKQGLRISRMGELAITHFSGDVFGVNGATVVPDNIEHLAAIWCFCSSPAYPKLVRDLDPSLKVPNATLAKVPFDLDHWTSVASQEYPNGLPEPYSNDPTQWIFHGHPCGSVEWDDIDKRTVCGTVRTDAAVLQVAVARLLGHRWPAEKDERMALATEQRDWVAACAPLLPLADADGIVCIPAVRGEPAAAERLRALLTASYEEEWDEGVLADLLASANGETLDDWLRNRFFVQHCKLFHNRPFIWHIWDGRGEDGFHALVNYHKLAAPDGDGRRCLESLAYSYLGDWITRQQDAINRDEPGAEGRLAAAQALQARLDAILTGEPPHDIFVRWKPLNEQPIGWEPDINDGVRPNIRPFVAQDILGGKKGAGVLRTKPNIHWRKDRGKEPHRPQTQFPWFWRNGEFHAERVNDFHPSLGDKRSARAYRLQQGGVSQSASI